MNVEGTLNSLLAVTVIAVLAPLIVGLLRRPRIPQVVVLLAGGMIIGPYVLGFGSATDIQPLADVGLGFVFLLAGYEIDTRMFGQDAGRRAIVSWVITAVLAIGVVTLLGSVGLVRAFVPVGLALTTTAFGTLLPVLREAGMLDGKLGRYLLAAGAVGELFPIIAIALFLGIDNRFVALLSLAAVAVLALLLGLASRLIRTGTGRVLQIILDGQHATTQTTLRFTMLLLVLLLAVTEQFHLDAVLGAFLAGMVLRRWVGASAPDLESKLDVIGYGFFIPIFFVYSGMTLDLRSIAAAPLRLVLFAVLMLLVRGLPALLVYRKVLVVRERVQVALVSATALPLLVALAEIGLRNGTMLPENAAALVGAGVLTVLILPAAAVALHRPVEGVVEAPVEPPGESEPSRGGSAGAGAPGAGAPGVATLDVGAAGAGASVDPDGGDGTDPARSGETG